MPAQVGVRTPALAMEPHTRTHTHSSPPKRKTSDDQDQGQDLKSSKASRTDNLPPPPPPSHADLSPTSSDIPASCCSSNETVPENYNISLLDLEVESAHVETATCNDAHQFERESEMNNSNKVPENSQEQEIDSRRSLSAAEKMPSELELEEFFAAAEKDIQKRFQDRYNYDIVKDVPLEGRYEWVQLKP
ncbi:hypothetical protein Fmac_002402 [Flemingia macrophylla]|uniref:Cyclin-dependent kinase inhibitor domain-containing protein n=1 Tax=Flemingia macrophylla TaxID=520843 RepID=A0ABD1NJT6_9FABA